MRSAHDDVTARTWGRKGPPQALRARPQAPGGRVQADSAGGETRPFGPEARLQAGGRAPEHHAPPTAASATPTVHEVLLLGVQRQRTLIFKFLEDTSPSLPACPQIPELGLSGGRSCRRSWSGVGDAAVQLSCWCLHSANGGPTRPARSSAASHAGTCRPAQERRSPALTPDAQHVLSSMVPTSQPLTPRAACWNLRWR